MDSLAAVKLVAEVCMVHFEAQVFQANTGPGVLEVDVHSGSSDMPIEFAESRYVRRFICASGE